MPPVSINSSQTSPQSVPYPVFRRSLDSVLRPRIEMLLTRIIPTDWKVFFSGKEIKPPKNEYNGDLPTIICAGRPGLETLIRRLVIGRKRYPNIEMAQGTVTGYDVDPEKPRYLSKVLFRRASDNKIISIPATMVIGVLIRVCA